MQELWSQPEEAGHGPPWAQHLQRREGPTPGVPLDLARRHCEESSSVSCNLNKVLKNYWYLTTHIWRPLPPEQNMSEETPVLTLALARAYGVTEFHLPSLLFSLSVKGTSYKQCFPGWESHQSVPTTCCQFSSTISAVLPQIHRVCLLAVGKKILYDVIYLSHLQVSTSKPTRTHRWPPHATTPASRRDYCAVTDWATHMAWAIMAWPTCHSHFSR